MPIHKSDPKRFTPRGLCDAYDSTDAFLGACKSLQNLIFDQANPEIVVARPGIGAPLTTFASFTTPTYVSVFITVGSMVYGMVSTGRNAGYDEPFAFNTFGDSFTTISNVLSSNVPISPSTTGDWVPPTMAMIGTKIIVTHPGFNGSATSGSFTGNATSSTSLVITGASGTIQIGMNLAGAGVAAGTYITGFVSGVYGGNGTYTVNQAITVSGAMTSAGGNFFGVIDLAVPTSPVWYSANTAIYGLTSVPVAVANFNNRAYYACGNTSFFSDVLAPLGRTSAFNSITHGDTTPITAYCGLPVATTSSGIVQALTVFKAFQIWQITGDIATGFPVPLQNNYLSLSLGSNSPRSVVQTPIGVIFVAVDGPYFVDPFGVVRPLTKEEKSQEQDLQIPFQNVRFPTRTAAGFIGSIYRAAVYTTLNGSPVEYEYWFDMNRRRWTGPHTFAFDCMGPVANYFIVSDESTGAALFESPVLPSTSSVYNDNGTAITCLLTTSSMPKDGKMAQRQVVESTIELSSYGVSTNYLISGLDDQNNILNQVTVSTVGSGSIWGTNLWGPIPIGSGSLWSTTTNIPHVYNIQWSAPLVFQKLNVQVQVTANTAVSIGTQFHRFEETGYTNAG